MSVQPNAWTPTTYASPRTNEAVDWIAADGTLVSGGLYQGDGVWRLPSGEQVYYCPVFWRQAQ